MTAEAAHLVLDGLTVRFGTHAAAVDAVSLEVRRGELVSLLGPSGCGKTTTLRAVAGFLRPSAGRIVLAGRDLSAMPAHKRNMGVVFQSYALFPHLDVTDNVAFGLRMRGIPEGERRKRALAALDMVSLAHLGGRYPAALSGGQQQRVALARALVIEPDVLLLDEPLSNLDAHLREEMRQEIRQLQQRLAITTLFVTHDQNEALAMSDRIAVMNGGKLLEAGAPDALCNNPRDPFTASFLGARSVIRGVATKGVFSAPGLSCAGAPEAATAIVLRAARLSLDPPVSGALTLAGVLASSTYLGDTFALDVETPAGRVRLLVPSTAAPPAIGMACRIGANPGGVSFLV